MSDATIQIRLMKAGDLGPVIALDQKILNAPRPKYYEMRFDLLFHSRDYLPASLVAETVDGAVVGFVMGEVYVGEYGIFEEAATLDTIGVDPAYRHLGIGASLIREFLDHLKALGVQKLYTLVGEDDAQLTRFFTRNRFLPSKRISLERSL